MNSPATRRQERGRAQLILRTFLAGATIACIAAAAGAVVCRKGPTVFGVEIVLRAALAASCFSKGAIPDAIYASLLCFGSAIFWLFFSNLSN
jgi:hypothetical protein